MPFSLSRRGRWLVAGLWLAVAIGLLPRAASLEDRLEVQARILGSQSAEVEQDLVRRFASPFAVSAILVLRGVPGPAEPEGRRVLEAAVQAIAHAPGVTRTISYLDRPDPLFLGEGGGTFMVVGLDPAEGRVDRLVPALRARVAALQESLRPSHPTAVLRLTGEGPINHDLWRTSTDDARRAERRTLPLTSLLLLLAFGTVGAAVLPVVVGALAVLLALGLAAVLVEWVPLSILVVNVASMLGLALGIDYALLTVSRFREARSSGEDVEGASALAARHAGRTVALSGVPVAIGFVTLLLVPLLEMRSAALGGLLVTFVSVLLAVSLLPALLAALGPRVEAGRIPVRHATGSSNAYRRLAAWVVARPALALALAVPPVLLLAVQARRLTPTLPRAHWLPAATDSAQAERDLASMGRLGVLHSLRVVLELPADVQALSRQGWDATRRLAEALARDPRVAAVRSLRSLLGDGATGVTHEELQAAAFLPAPAKRTFLGEEGDLVLLEVIPRSELDLRGQIALVRDVRAAGFTSGLELPGARVRVGGLPAFGADYEDALAGRFRGVVGLVVMGTLLALFAGFRSLLVPLKAVLLNLLSVAAAFGALVLVFQDGHGVGLFGLPGPVDGVFPIVPALVFCSVFGLSMDYEVFLVARVREERLRGRSEDEAIVEGVARTGPLITSAAAVMIAVFAAFTGGGFVVMKMLGFTLAVAVLLDATVIRLVIGPALLHLAGRHNWWPGGHRDQGGSTGPE